MKSFLLASFAAALLAACSSPPELKFPTGENRVPVNVKAAAAAASEVTTSTTTTGENE